MGNVNSNQIRSRIQTYLAEYKNEKYLASANGYQLMILYHIGVHGLNLSLHKETQRKCPTKFFIGRRPIVLLCFHEKGTYSSINGI